MKKKTKRQLEADIATSLAERARAQGFEPETEEGGRAMLRSLTFADIAKAKPRGASLKPGTPVIVHYHQVGGTTQLQGIVAWDNGRGSVEVKIPAYGNRVMRAKKDANGRLSTYG